MSVGRGIGFRPSRDVNWPGSRQLWAVVDYANDFELWIRRLRDCGGGRIEVERQTRMVNLRHPALDLRGAVLGHPRPARERGIRPERSRWEWVEQRRALDVSSLRGRVIEIRGASAHHPGEC